MNLILFTASYPYISGGEQNILEIELQRSLSIVLLGTQMALGGAQKLLLEQAHWFLAHGHKVTVIFFYDRDDLHEKWQNLHPFQILNLNAFNKEESTFGKIKKLSTGMWSLWKILKQEKFDAIITFTHDSNILGLPLAWLAGIPARVGTHLGEIRGMPAWRERLHTVLINLGIIQILIASSTRTRQNAIQVGVRPERIQVIFNAITPFDLGGVDRNSIRHKLGLQENDIFLLSVGRLVYEKGHEFLVKAMTSVTMSSQNIVVGICGGGPLHDQLQDEIASLNLEGKVMLLGQWENLQELLAAADIFVLPSRWEGLPMALLEAMMAGLPVVATRVEGVEEVIENGVHGLLVPLENPIELSKAILQLSNAPEQRKEMGEAAKQHILNSYTTDHMCEQYLDVIRKYLGESNAG